MYSIEFTKQAVKALKAMPRNVQTVVVDKIESLAHEPLTAPNVKKLVGVPGYRLRVGNWRVIFDVESGRLGCAGAANWHSRRYLQMSDVQVIEKDGKPAFYVVPADLWEKVRDTIEDAEDAAAASAARAGDDGVRVPIAVVKAQLEGAHPVKAWREHRGMSQDALAKKSGLSKPFISQIENGKRAGPTATIRKLAAALDVPLDALT